VGGAAVLSTYFKNERTANPNTLLFTAGDAVGATPPISAFFQDTPTIEVMRLMGFNADTLGNHNFDAGLGRLRDQVALAGSTTAAGTPFTYVSANLTNLEAEGLGAIKPYTMFEVAGVKVAVIGITNPEAPTLVFPGNFGSIEITDPVSQANKAKARAQADGAQVIIALTHQGITGFDPATGLAFGPLIDFANNIGGFDLIVGDHTDFQYSGYHNNALVVENRSKGVTYARINLRVDPGNGRIISRSVTFVSPLANAVTPDLVVAALVSGYRAQLTPILGTVIGSATRTILRSDTCGRADGRLCESLVGNVTTDAMRLTYGTDFAITNSGGLRDRLTCPDAGGGTGFCPPAPPSNQITRGQVLAVLPFGNIVVTLSLNGAELKSFLENGVSSMPGANGRFPQVSGMCFTYDISAPVGSRVTGAVRQAADGSCTGAAVDLTAAAAYTVATNDFMANGGDGYPNVYGRSVTRDIMDQVLANYVTANSPVAPSIQGRIVCTTSGATLCPVILP
jgi:2',3'-cyclic-nucleotide 2'-phosphodiesterase (5'-nucleotidase family)